MNIAIAMIACQRQCIGTRTAIKNLRFGGFYGQVDVFAEPGCEIKNSELVTVHRNSENLGGQANWRQALCWLLENTNSNHLMVVEDDVDYCISAKRALLKAINKPYGYISLHTPEKDREALKTESGWVDYNTGYVWGTQAICFSRHTLEKFIRHDKLWEGQEEPYDFIMCQFYKNEISEPTYYHVPSLADHVGWEETTLANKDINLSPKHFNKKWRRGLMFNKEWTDGY